MMPTIHPAERGAQKPSAVSLHPSPFVDRLLRCYTQPAWQIAPQVSSGKLTDDPGSPRYDASVEDVANGPAAVRLAARSLRQLGRLFLVATNDCQSAIDRAIEPVRAEFSPIADLECASGERVIVAERTPPEGTDFVTQSNHRADVHLGAYKMSRYRTYHAMQAAAAQFLPIGTRTIRDVIEIGDTNGVIRAMLGHSPRNYFQARYPEHDLQTLEKVASDSFDVFICDNTLEHVADPHAGLRQMRRVLRPGGWAILMLPFIAMAQDDDRCRFSPLALGEALRDQFPEGLIGSWGNVDAGCVYLRDNKWSRVLRAEWPANAGLGDCMMRCRDSRDPAAPMVTISCRNDRQHPIHVWALVRKPFEEPTPGQNLPATSQFTSLHVFEAQASDLLFTHLPAGERITVLGIRDGSFLDELTRKGFQVTAIDSEPWRVNHARMRGHRALLQAANVREDIRDSVARSTGLCDLRSDPSSSVDIVEKCLRGLSNARRMFVTTSSPAWSQLATSLNAVPIKGTSSTLRAWATK